MSNKSTSELMAMSTEQAKKHGHGKRALGPERVSITKTNGQMGTIGDLYSKQGWDYLKQACGAT